MNSQVLNQAKVFGNLMHSQKGGGCRESLRITSSCMKLPTSDFWKVLEQCMDFNSS